MIVALLVAMQADRGIGIANRLPWRLSDDLKLFKQVSMGHHLLMGRKTYESIGRNLPGRTNIVLTRQEGFRPEGALVAHSLESALELARQAGESEAFIIGGGEIFSQALPLADRIYLSLVHASLPCDTFFPEIAPQAWRPILSKEYTADERNEYSFTYTILDRVTGEHSKVVRRPRVK